MRGGWEQLSIEFEEPIEEESWSKMTSTLQKKTGMGWGWWTVTVLFVAVIIASVTLAAKYRRHGGGSGGGSALIPYGTPYTPMADSSINFTEAVRVTLTFFDVQKSGRLPKDNPIPWRGDAALNDGDDVGLDLSGGLFDAGDHVKFGLPLAYTGTILAWSVLEYQVQLTASGLLPEALDAIKWITDFLIIANPSSETYFFQVGDAQADHDCWLRDEDLGTVPRPSYQVNSTIPGSDVAGEASAALAAASLVFRGLNQSYSQTLLTHAEQLFDFADKYRGSYSQSVTEVQAFYNSTGYVDELLWAAAWLYSATGDVKYVEYVVMNGPKYANWGKSGWFSWDDKLPGVQVLLARAQLLNSSNSNSKTFSAGLVQYKKTADTIICSLLPDSPTATHQRTKGNMLWISPYNAAQHAVGAAFLTIVYSDYLVTSQQVLTCSGKIFKPERLREFASTQAAYLLGINPMKTSYLVGYGAVFPQFVHHRGASIPDNSVNYTCKDGFQFLDSPQPNPNIATGALVGGPFLNDSYSDARRNSMQNEPTTYNSAVFAGLLAGLASSPGAPAKWA